MRGNLTPWRPALAVPVGLAACGLCIFSVNLALGVCAAAVAVSAARRFPRLTLGLLVVLTPFSGTMLLDTQIGGIPGLKPANLLALVPLAAYAFSPTQKDSPQKDDPWKHDQHRELWFLAGVLVILTVGVLRGLPHLSVLRWFWQDPMTVDRYFLSNLVRPALFLVPFFIIVVYLRRQEDLLFVINAVYAGVGALSLYILATYAFAIPAKGDFELVRAALGKPLALRGNGISTFFTIAYPVILMRALSRKSAIDWTMLSLSLAAVAVLYSRTAYGLILLSTGMVLLLTRHFRTGVIMVAVGICIALVLPATVADRALSNLHTRNLDLITAGRSGEIWLPLIDEYVRSPVKLLLGAGRYAVIYSDAAASNRIIPVAYAHNMYLDVVCESGLVGLFFFLIAYRRFRMMVKADALAPAPAATTAVMQGISVSMTCFMISGLTDRTFMPTLDNSYVWILVAVALGLMRTHRSEES